MSLTRHFGSAALPLLEITWITNTPGQRTCAPGERNRSDFRSARRKVPAR
ncbi:hypothetical protein STRIP9103_02763 [Streptomyces ipomoeae 91-03]|uniref:Uncharacterized protein n=1 Tax=Streptomyces ipomoeae 91-03 TaxID=698759 RepID=L1KRF1_9ACTN|nr:hypothetical protein STRIP9103_02763 [Streptomyces ipomoeae 91-03]